MKNKTLTSGNITKSIAFFALPIILSNLLQNFYNFTDTALVGQAMNETALGAVGATSSIITLCTSTILGLMTGFSITCGKACGAENNQKIRKTFVNSLILTIIIGAFISVLGPLCAHTVLKLMSARKEYIDLSTRYLSIILCGLPSVMFYNLFGEMLRAVGDSKKPLLFLIISSLIHLLLSYIFLFLFKFEVSGVAAATVLSQIVSAAMCFFYIRKNVPVFHFTKEDFRFDKAVLKECLSVGLPLALTNFVLSFGLIILQFFTNKIGSEYVVAFSSASQLGYLQSAVLNGFATAASVFVAQNYGAKKFSRIKQCVSRTFIMLFSVNIIFLVLLLFSVKPLLAILLNGNEKAVNNGFLYLKIRTISLFFFSIAALLKSVLSGMGKTRFPTVSGFIEIGMRYIFPILFSGILGFASIPLTDTFSWAILSLLFLIAYPIEMKIIKKELSE